MKRTAHTIPALALVFSAASGCGSEKIDADVTYLSDSSAPTAASGTWLEIMFSPDASVDASQEFRLRMDGHWVLVAPDDSEYVELHATGEFGKAADNLAFAAHMFQSVVYGSKDKLEYSFFANTDAELASDPSTLTTLADCTIVADSFAYGQTWQAIVPWATNLGIPCDAPNADSLCNLVALGRSCFRRFAASCHFSPQTDRGRPLDALLYVREI